MASYLLMWNPKYYSLVQFREAIKNYSKAGDEIMYWTCHNTHVKIGDRVYLMVAESGAKTMKYSSGICASGTVVKEPYKDRHWNDSRKQTTYIQFKVEKFIDPSTNKVLSKQDLITKVNNQQWSYQSSGITINDHVAKKLELVWKDFAGVSLGDGGTIGGNENHDKLLHAKAQYYLAKIGEKAGCENHIARNDRNKVVFDTRLGDLSIEEVSHKGITPEAYNIIKLIDNLWVKRDSPICAFEVETTTSIYSGLLRMADLITTYRTHNIELFIVAPKSREDQVRKEVMRPSFQELKVHESCSFIAIEDLEELYDSLEKINFGINYSVIMNKAKKLT